VNVEGRVAIILGVTGSGKSAAAIQIALRTGAEVVSGDAFAVYCGLDVGTAKPGKEERRAVVHHLLDVADPREGFSAGRWAELARRAVDDVVGRGRPVVVAGGSHFYLRALLKGLPAGEVRDPGIRQYLSARSSPQDRVFKKTVVDLLDPAYSGKIHLADTARLNRAVEILLATGSRVSERRGPDQAPLSRHSLRKFALQISPEDLYTRIDERIRDMWMRGWRSEVELLLRSGVPPDAPGFRAIGYPEMVALVGGRIPESTALREIGRKTRSLAKRQRTWLRREEGVIEGSPADVIEQAVGFLRGE
jgi:tRNA dimethylallyltransferase